MNYVSQENLDNIVKGLSNKIAMSVSNGALIGDTTPVGTVISFMGTQAPLYYLVCDGTTYNIAEYQELADFIEAQFGAVNYFGGDGVDTFAVPDLRGEFLRGSGTNSHINDILNVAEGSGANVGEHQGATSVYKIDAEGNSIWIHNAPTYKSPGNFDATYITNRTGQLTVNHSDQNGTVMLYTIRPTNTSVLYCIKYTKAVIPSEYEDGTPVGRVIFDSILREGYIKANGAQIEDASISIPRLLSFVQKYSSQLIALDQATYEANVGLYMYDSNNDILTLPNYIGRFMEGGNSVESIEAGLPNIKGHTQVITGFINNTRWDDWGNPSTSALYHTKDNNWINQIFNSASNTSRDIVANEWFDASRSNSIYSDTVNIVQPSSITLIPQIRY